MKQLHALWRDESGFVVTSELLILVTIAVIGLIVGYVAVRDALVQELGDIAAAIGALDQSYYYNGVSNSVTGAFTRGSSFTDAIDSGDLANAPTAGAVGSIQINTVPTTGG